MSETCEEYRAYRRNHPAHEQAILWLYLAIAALERLRDDHLQGGECVLCQDANGILYSLYLYRDVLANEARGLHHLLDEHMDEVQAVVDPAAQEVLRRLGAWECEVLGLRPHRPAPDQDPCPQVLVMTPAPVPEPRPA